MRRPGKTASAIADDIATPRVVAEALKTTETGLAQMRYRGTEPSSSNAAAACSTAGRMSPTT